MSLSLRSALAALFFCLLWPAPAPAQPLCDSRARVLAHLAERYGEKPVALGVTNGGALLELLRRPDGTSWTIVVTTPPTSDRPGLTCLVAAGEGWRDRPAQEGVPEGPDT